MAVATAPAPAFDPAKLDAFMGKAVTDLGAALHAALIVIGEATIERAVEEAGARLEGRGRVLVRSSGTEPLIRIMVEAPHESECEEIVQSLAKTAAQRRARNI